LGLGLWSRYGGGWRGGGFYGGYGGWDEPYVYREGIIAVDLYDARSKAPIWHASVNQSLFGAIGAEAEQKIDKAVAVLFTKYRTHSRETSAPPVGIGRSGAGLTASIRATTRG
jgi:hypothetical protein